MRRLLDTILTLILAPFLAAWAIVTMLSRFPVVRTQSDRRLLFLDASYSLELMRTRDLLHSITSLDFGGFFSHVWTVHPLSGASPEHENYLTPGAPYTVDITSRHTVISGSVGRYQALVDLPHVNFLLAQASLFNQLLRLARANLISIVQASDPYYLGLMGWLVARGCRVPLVIQIQANYDSIYSDVGDLAYPRIFKHRRIEKVVDRWVLNRAQLVIVGSENNLEFAVGSGAARHRVIVIRSGNMLHNEHFASPEGRGPLRPDVPSAWTGFAITVSRLERVKRCDEALRAFAMAAERDPGWGFVLVGDGSMRAELEQLARELGIAGRVWFTGVQDQKWIAAALAKASVVVSPLTGRALREAALAATPIVAFDVEWQSEVLQHRRTGLLVPDGDVAAMADAIVELLTRPEFASELGVAARSFALETMGPEATLASHRQAYGDLLDGWNGSGRGVAK